MSTQHTYQISTRLYMKDYNADKFFITPDYVEAIRVDANDVNETIQLYREQLDDEYGITISDNAIKNRDLCYNKDGGPCGYILTGRTLFSDRSANYEGYQYIDVCARIDILTSAF